MQIRLVSEISRRMTTFLTAAKVSAEGAFQSQRPTKLAWLRPCRCLKGSKVKRCLPIAKASGSCF